MTVGEEVDYLSSYLALEKMRFKDGIDFSISVDPAIDRGSVLIGRWACGYAGRVAAAVV